MVLLIKQGKTTAWLLAYILSTSSLALADSGRVVARPVQTFRGWGMSLAWEANDLYGGGRQPAQIKDPNIQSQHMDLLYGDPATRLTLGFNIARYNIGAATIPRINTCEPMPRWKAFKADQAQLLTGHGMHRNDGCCKRRRSGAPIFLRRPRILLLIG